MTTFQKHALAGNAITQTGKLLEFHNNFYTTEDEAETEYLKTFDCYTEVEAAVAEAAAESAPEAPVTSKVGTISSATLVTTEAAPAPAPEATATK